MTTHQLLLLFLRRWYVYVLAILVVGLAVFSLNNSPRIYSATAELEFQAPKRLPRQVAKENPVSTLIYFTGAVVKKYDAEFPNIPLSSPNATLFGNGIHEGVAVEAAAVGNQWVINFVRPVVQIQVASSNPDEVLPTIERVAAELKDMSRSMQMEAGTDPRYFVTSDIDFNLVTVYSFGQTRTGRYLGTATLIGVALLLATLVARGIDRFILTNKGPAGTETDQDTNGSASKAPEPVKFTPR